MSAAVRQWRGFAAATRLGWEISSNWTRPLMFMIYSVLRPLSAAFILVVIYRFISGGSGGTSAYLAFLVTGVAFDALDVDGDEGLATLARLEATYGALPPSTPRCESSKRTCSRSSSRRTRTRACDRRCTSFVVLRRWSAIGCRLIPGEF